WASFGVVFILRRTSPLSRGPGPTCPEPRAAAALPRASRFLVCHGDADAVVRPGCGGAVRQALEAAGTPVSFHSYPGLGHGSCEAELKHLEGFLRETLFWVKTLSPVKTLFLVKTLLRVKTLFLVKTLFPVKTLLPVKTRFLVKTRSTDTDSTSLMKTLFPVKTQFGVKTQCRVKTLFWVKTLFSMKMLFRVETPFPVKTRAVRGGPRFDAFPRPLEAEVCRRPSEGHRGAMESSGRRRRAAAALAALATAVVAPLGFTAAPRQQRPAGLARAPPAVASSSLRPVAAASPRDGTRVSMGPRFQGISSPMRQDKLEAKMGLYQYEFEEDGGMYDIIKYPLLTEKACMLMEEYNTYTFLVDRRANKPQIRAAVETVFGVKVKKCNTLIPMAKFTREFGRKIGRKSVYKKASTQQQELLGGAEFRRLPGGSPSGGGDVNGLAADLEQEKARTAELERRLAAAVLASRVPGGTASASARPSQAPNRATSHGPSRVNKELDARLSRAERALGAASSLGPPKV
ncbi:unnamed protein product, partial [Prorocentrum cordatum]